MSASCSCLALLVDDGDAALLAERRVGQHHVEALAGLAAQARPRLRPGLVCAVAADAVQEQVHGAEPGDAVDDFQPKSVPLLSRFFCVASSAWCLAM